jgi:ribose transport system substrate-binding protein
MMKRFLAILLTVAMLMVPMAGCSKDLPSASTGAASVASTAASADEANKSYRIGFAVNDLTNPVFANVATKLKALGDKDNVQITTLDCGSNASKQITQVENFIQTGMNAIVIQCADPTALKSVLKKARDKGIKVLAWDDDLGESDDAAWLIKNYDLGTLIGEAAAKWMNDKLGGKGEVAILNYPSLAILVERAKGITDAVAKNASNAKIVATSSAINTTQGMSATETILQAHPNVKVIICIGDGGAVGAAEAVKGAGKLTDDFGIFSADATDEALSNMMGGGAIRTSVSEGTTTGVATDIFNNTMKLIKNESVPKQIYRVLTPVSMENVKDFYQK